MDFGLSIYNLEKEDTKRLTVIVPATSYLGQNTVVGLIPLKELLLYKYGYEPKITLTRENILTDASTHLYL